MDIGEFRSLWDKAQKKVWKYYCPLCRNERRARSKPTPSPRQIFQVFLTAVFFMICTWPWFGWRGIISFVPFFAAFEIYHRTRVRMQMTCPDCGFDPYLYLTDVPRARKEVESHWRKKFVEKGIPYPEKKNLLGEEMSEEMTQSESEDTGERDDAALD
ncbi:MAG: hypothetical protein AAB425_07970, partial [Bdellovibrionota bacterium]